MLDENHAGDEADKDLAGGGSDKVITGGGSDIGPHGSTHCGLQTRKVKRKDPNAPKMPLSSYLEFSKMERLKIREELGPLSMLEVGRELGTRWNSLTRSRRQCSRRKQGRTG